MSCVYTSDGLPRAVPAGTAADRAIASIAAETGFITFVTMAPERGRTSRIRADLERRNTRSPSLLRDRAAYNGVVRWRDETFQRTDRRD